MASVNWGKISKIIEKEAIQNLGERTQVVLTPQEGAYSSSRPQDGPSATQTSYTAYAVTVGQSKRSRNAAAVDVSRGAIDVLISGELAVEPRVGWECTLHGLSYRVTKVIKTQPGSSAVLYTITVER